MISWSLATPQRFLAFAPVHPLLVCVICLMAGIATAAQAHSIIISAILIPLSILIAYSMPHIGKAGMYLTIIAPCFFISGLYLYARHIHSFEQFYTTFSNQPLSITATVIAIDRVENPRFTHKILISTTAIHSNKGTDTNAREIMIYTRRPRTLQVADTIRLESVIIKHCENKSFLLYLCKQKIAATLFIPVLHYQKLLKRPSLLGTIEEMKQSLTKRIQKSMGKSSFALFSSIFLGNRDCVKNEMNFQKESFKIWGISHYLARSGLHLVLFVIVWNFLLSLLPLYYILKQLILMSLIIIYACLSWSSVSFERALLMFLVYKFCTIAGRPTHYVHLITLVTGIVLLFNPVQLFFLDFQLSFGLTFALAWFNHVQAYKKQFIA